MHKCYSNRGTVTVALAYNILLFFSLSISLSLFLSSLTLTSRSLFLHWSLLLSQVSPQQYHRRSPHSPLLTPIAVASPITTAFTNRRCYLFSLSDGFGILINGFWWSATPLLSRVLPQPCHRWSPHSPLPCWSPLLSFFFVWWFWDFDQWILMVLISGFDDFD